MFRLLLTTALLATAYAACEDFAINYVMPPPGGKATMNVSVCAEENIIRSSMAATDDFAGVSILEDYNVGFGATRVEAEEACYIHKLQFDTLKKQAKVLRSKKTVPLNVNQSVELISVPVEEPSEYGSRIEEFCGELPVVKVGINEEDPAEVRALTWETSEDDEQARCIGLNFRNCILILFIPVCTLTSLTFPTGVTVTFTWFFFG